MERILAAERTHHLGYEKHDPKGNNSGNSRNGHACKRLLTDQGPLEIAVPPAVESLNRQLRKVLKTRSSFPTDEAALKLIWIALGNASQKWTHPIHNWDLAIQQFAICFDGRIDPSTTYGGVDR